MSVNFAQVRERLERRRVELLNRTRRVERDLHRLDAPLSADFSERAVEVQNDATLAAIGRAADVEIAEIDEALQRLNEGEYGICKSCGRPIEARRLLALPQSVRCAGCWA
jgi:DnaK suppressor protein